MGSCGRKIKIPKNEYDDMARDEARKYAEGNQSYAEMLRRIRRYTK